MNIDGLIIPEGYKSKYSLIETEVHIKKIKDFFEKALAENLNLTRVSAPLFVEPNTGVNDNLNGIERPVSFDLLESKKEVQIVHSLAKWKRYSLHRYGFKVGEGLYADMNAIRRDEELDNLHSIYVDQWDWEKIIEKQDRNIETLKDIVKKIYSTFKAAEEFAKNNGIEIEVFRERGIPRIFKRYGKRVGVYIGVAVFALIVWYSGRIVWYIAITGNTSAESSEIIDNLEKLLAEELGCLATIHMDPIVTNDPRVNELKEKVKEIVLQIQSNLNIHDFRVVWGESHTNLIFDILAPFDLKYSDEELTRLAEENVKQKLGDHYCTVIDVDKDYNPQTV